MSQSAEHSVASNGLPFLLVSAVAPCARVAAIAGNLVSSIIECSPSVKAANVMKHLFSPRGVAALIASGPIRLAVALALIPTSAIAEYKLQSGDTLEISVAGVPDLRQRSPIGVDGDIDLPLAGQIQVRGLSVSEARAKITQNLSNKLYQQTTNDGHEVQHMILPDTIVVMVAEYRPIYVNGDVARPGEHPFQPGMTVRHAVAIAGGYDVMQFRLANPVVQTADFQAEYEALWAEYATEQARIWRLRTELGEQGVEYAGNKAPIPAELGERLMQVETEHLKARLADRERDKALLRDAITKASLQLNTLADKKKKDEEGNEADAEDFEKVRALSEKGVTTTSRLSEARRSALLSADQLLQTIVEMSNIDRQRSEYTRQLEKIDSQSHIDAWRDLQDANLRLAQITARLKSAGDKLTYTSMLPSQLTPGRGGRLDITVYRKGENGPERLTADEDLELAPGDVVDVALETKSLADTLNQQMGGR
jgi:polysaccharide export outer membrane protein